MLQGCGGAMMVPVGRLTLVRTFAKSELIRAMSFVAIPALIGPMLGPIAGGLIVGYLHWRFIFFVNIPIGLVGLLMVYLHLPDYREEKTNPLDIVGLILFGSGIALLSYVLEIFGDHTLSTREILGQGENISGVEFVRHGDQTRIGKIGRRVAIFIQYLLNLLNTGGKIKTNLKCAFRNICHHIVHSARNRL